MEHVSSHYSGIRIIPASFGQRILTTLLALDARYRQAQAFKRLDKRLRDDIGAPEWDAPRVMRRN